MAFRGSFNDGRTAARHEVLVELGLDELSITASSGQVLARWPYGGLERIDEDEFQDLLRLGCRGGYARLIVRNRVALAELRRRAPQLRRRRGSWRGGIRAAMLALGSVAVVAGFFWFALPQMAALVARFVPPSWEEALGRHLREQVVAVLGGSDGTAVASCAKPDSVSTLERLIARLAAGSAAPYRFQVIVLDFPLNNAFALPGGHIILFSGLIDFANSPDEVAGVLAHEMGHVIGRHGTEALIKNAGLSLVFGALFGDAGLGLAGGLGEMLIRQSYSREAEAEADRAAVMLLQAAGIRVTGLARFLRRLALDAQELPSGLTLLSSHPPSERRARLIEEIGEAGEPGMTGEEWRALREICVD